MSKVIWKKRDLSKNNSLEKVLGVPKLISELLSQRGTYDFESAKAYFRPSLNNLHDPFLMNQMKETSSTFRAAVRIGNCNFRRALSENATESPSGPDLVPVMVARWPAWYNLAVPFPSPQCWKNLANFWASRNSKFSNGKSAFLVQKSVLIASSRSWLRASELQRSL